MKILRRQLRQIIREEIIRLNETSVAVVALTPAEIQSVKQVFDDTLAGADISESLETDVTGKAWADVDDRIYVPGWIGWITKDTKSRMGRSGLEAVLKTVSNLVGKQISHKNVRWGGASGSGHPTPKLHDDIVIYASGVGDATADVGSGDTGSEGGWGANVKWRWREF